MKDRHQVAEKFLSILERLFEDMDRRKILAEVNTLRERHPDASREHLAELLTTRIARKTATVGAAAGTVPGPAGILAIAPDVFNLVRQQSRLILAIAILYDHDPDVPERFREVLATLAVSVGVTVGRQGIRRLAMAGLEHALAEKMARKIAGRYLARKVPAMAPVVGSLIGGTINYLAVRSVGRVAVQYYKRQAAEASKLLEPAEPLMLEQAGADPSLKVAEDAVAVPPPLTETIDA